MEGGWENDSYKCTQFLLSSSLPNHLHSENSLVIRLCSVLSLDSKYSLREQISIWFCFHISIRQDTWVMRNAEFGKLFVVAQVRWRASWEIIKLCFLRDEEISKVVRVLYSVHLIIFVMILFFLFLLFRKRWFPFRNTNDQCQRFRAINSCGRWWWRWWRSASSCYCSAARSHQIDLYTVCNWSHPCIS